MMQVAGCAECKRTWEDYSEAVMDHIRISNKYQLATLRHDAALALELWDRMTTAESVRRLRRTETLAHSASHLQPETTLLKWKAPFYAAASAGATAAAFGD